MNLFQLNCRYTFVETEEPFCISFNFSIDLILLRGIASLILLQLLSRPTSVATELPL